MHAGHLVWASLVCVAAVGVAASDAQIAFDGTTGAAGVLVGPDYTIDAAQGTTKGKNLFHSFETFDILSGESATFTGPGGLRNVISRVTGGNSSTIDGLLRSEVPGADFWFINPSGVTFGAGASIDVPAAFHVSTADHIRFGDGELFSATNPDASTLTVAAPEAFGFLGKPKGSLTLTDSTLEVAEGQTLSLVGGDITLDASNVTAPGGTINLITAGSKGEVRPKTGKITFSTGSDIRMENGSLVEVSGNAGGTIRLIGGRIDIEASTVAAENTGSTDSRGGIEVAANELGLTEGAIISATTFGAGDGGAVTIIVGSLVIIGVATEEGVEFDTGINSNAGADSTGDSGSVAITADTIQLSNSGLVSTSTLSIGNGGALTIDAGRLLMNGGILISESTGESFSVSAGFGNAGDITVTADLIEVKSSAIRTTTFTSGDAGSVTIRAGSLLIFEDDPFGLSDISSSSIHSSFEPGGNAGQVTITADRLEARGIAQISTSSFGAANAGNVTVTAEDIFLVDGSSITSQVEELGRGGTVHVSGARISLADGAFISTAALEQGTAGNLTVSAGELTLGNNSKITTTSDSGKGGDIILQVYHLLSLDDSSITTSAGGLSGDGGNITIDPTFVVLRNGLIQANAVGGKGGNVSITTDFLFADSASVIEASSELGIDGTVSLSSPASDVTGSLVALQGSFFDAGAELGRACASRPGEPGSSLARATRGAVPADPGRPMLAGYADLGGRNTAYGGHGTHAFTDTAAIAIPGSQGCGSLRFAAPG